MIQNMMTFFKSFGISDESRRPKLEKIEKSICFVCVASTRPHQPLKIDFFLKGGLDKRFASQSGDSQSPSLFFNTQCSILECKSLKEAAGKIHSQISDPHGAYLLVTPLSKKELLTAIARGQFSHCFSEAVNAYDLIYEPPAGKLIEKIPNKNFNIEKLSLDEGSCSL